MRGASVAGVKKSTVAGVAFIAGLSTVIFFSAAFPAGAQEGLRDGVAVTELAPAPHSARVEKQETRRIRNYPEQPPVIPHSIDGYEISLRANKCLSCHSRRRTVATGAPMPSVTHFMDRDLQVLSDLSPRRYFCTQCHVSQTTATPPVGNTFIDAADLPASD